MMTKKDFEALADELRPYFADSGEEWSADSHGHIIQALCRFGAGQNPKFDADKFVARLTATGVR